MFGLRDIVGISICYILESSPGQGIGGKDDEG